MASESDEYFGTVLVAGPPGAGKTTVAEKLALQLPGPLVHIEGDKFFSFFVKDKPGQAKVDRPEQAKAGWFGLLMRSITAATTPFVRAGYNVLIDFAFPPDFLDTLHKQRNKADLVERLHYIILRPSLEVCKSRAANREGWRIDDYTRYLGFYEQFENLPLHTISDDHATPTELADYIMRGLEDEKYLVT